MKIIALVGCTASGKDTILKEVLKRDGREFIEPIISTTSRPMRPGEVEGKSYYFINNEKAKEMLENNRFIEYRKYSIADGEIWFYGIDKDAIDFNKNITYIAIIDLQGLKQLKKYLALKGKGDNLISIYIDTKAQIRLLRALRREGELTDVQVNEICRRNLDDYNNVLQGKEYCDCTMENNTKNDFERCVKNILYISRNEDKWLKNIIYMM